MGALGIVNIGVKQRTAFLHRETNFLVVIHGVPKKVHSWKNPLKMLGLQDS